MILILSNSNDISTGHVAQWLRHFKQDFIRINRNDGIALDEVRLGQENNLVFHSKERKVAADEISSFWFRRGDFDLETTGEITLDDESCKASIKNSMYNERKVVSEFLNHTFKSKKSIGSYETRGMNKLFALDMAKKAGISIPETLLTTQKNELQDFYQKHGALICKPIFEVPITKAGIPDFIVYTNTIDDKIIDKLEDTFFPSLFQKRLDKKYELRIFYLDGECYANAIFSQLDNKTAVDLRNYNFKNPNRRVGFKVPKKLQTKLQDFMAKVNLNCGSIDMIVTPDNDYVLLEVNPIGQFGMTSLVANYRLEKKVAEFLMQN